MYHDRMSEPHSVIASLRNDSRFMSCVTHWHRIPPKEEEYAPFPGDLNPLIVESLRRRGIGRFYSHQAEAYRLARERRSFVVVTPTASGKTMCYNMPVLQTLLESPAARALYLFPTKALSQDQQSELNEIVLDGTLPVKVATYDGDTPSSVRVSARDSGRIVITNPDMLHSGILPNHPKWIKFMSNLSYIVIDELHAYRGVFGSHMTNVVRRLKRIARFYDSDPVFILCSATIGNPRELAERVVEESVEIIDRNGAPSGEKHVVLYNPPLVDPVQGIRRGTVLESQKIALRLLKAHVKTIVFARSRVRVELIVSYIRKSLANIFTEDSRIRVESYRGGYLPNERREIERGLRDGSVLGVVSTNALELGIDIGGLDAAILAGFPGSISSTWQQAGRAGRTTDVSLAILIATSGPIDQFMIQEPDYFFSRSPESGFVDPDNMYILLDHLRCAVFELPFAEGEKFGGPVGELLDYLEEDGVVRRTEGRWYWTDRSYPAEGVSLRSATSDNVVIVDTTEGRNAVIGEMDRPSAKELIFDNAVYLHRGRQFIVKELDIPNRRCYVEETDVNYYTDAIVKSDIKLLSNDSSTDAWGARLVLGDVLVRTQVSKFKKIRFGTHENVGYGEISLPEEEMHTRSLLLAFTPESSSGRAFDTIPEKLREQVIARVGAIVKNVAPVFLLCSSSDIGVAERLKDQYTGFPALYVYDSYPGGTGLAEGLSSKLRFVLPAARDLIARCPCEYGCPSCVGPDENVGAAGNHKTAVLEFLSDWLNDVSTKDVSGKGEYER